MVHKISKNLVSTFLFLIMSQSSFSYEEPNKKQISLKPSEIKIGVGGFFPTSNNKIHSNKGLLVQSFKKSLEAEVAITYHFNKNFTAELGVNYAKSSLKMKNKSINSPNYSLVQGKFIPISLLAQYNINIQKFNPYIGAGLSYFFVSGKNNVETLDKVKSIQHIVTGLKKRTY